MEFGSEGYRLMVGDCLESMRSLPDQSVHCCVTSPPYYGLRDYGVDGQIGLEQTPEEYVRKLVAAFREVHRLLRDDGTLWLNIGDSYAANRSYQVSDGKHKSHDFGKSNATRVPDGMKQKDLMGIPWMLAFALRADGWYLRQDIIWHKPNPMPESVRDRCTKAHEYLFLLSKSPRYYFDHEAMKEPASKGAAGSRFHTGKTGIHQLGRASTKPRMAGNKSHKYVTAHEASASDEHRTKAGLMKVADKPWETRNRRTVWTVASKPYSGAHFATFPPDLIEPCIMAGCPVGGIVLDPFGGSGTTAGVALKHGRQAVICELSADYAALIPDRVESIVRTLRRAG